MNKKTKKNKYIDLTSSNHQRSVKYNYIIIVTEIRHLTNFDLFQIKGKAL